ncbi:MAG: hypothetical protein H6635_10960 [Anaerolineales bacterium]|nr:hypothetical protein [Anaerolineales bacterium]MCB9145883.1 hypothetical protein [Anaerolineales bacterium]
MYIDPSSGGVLFQALAVVFALFSGTILAFSGKIRAGLAKLRRRNEETEEQDETKE